MTLIQYIRGNCVESPASAMRVADLLAHYRTATGSTEPRKALVSELIEGGFAVAVDARNVSHVVGIAIRPPEPIKIENGVIVKR